MCDCIDKLNEQLEERNLVVNSSFNLFNPDAPSRIALDTLFLKPHGKAASAKVYATYCPICGEKYKEATTP